MVTYLCNLSYLIANVAIISYTVIIINNNNYNVIIIIKIIYNNICI